MNRSQKLIHSGLLFLAYVFFGIRNSQHGAAFLDFAQITDTDVEQASYFYTAMSVGGIAGSFIMSYLYDKLPRHRLMLLTTVIVGAALTTSSLPWSTSFYVTTVIFFLNHAFNTAFDNGANASLMSTWGTEGKTFMQFLHFSFSAGTMISPFTVQPFLSTISGNSTSYCHYVQDSEASPNTYGQLVKEIVTNVSLNIQNNTAGLSMCTLSESRIHYAYLIAGILCLISGVAFGLEACIYRKENDRGENVKEDNRNQRVLPLWLFAIAVALVSSIYFFHSAVITTVVGYLMAFSVEGLGWSKDEGTMLTFVFWLGFTLSRLVGVVVVRFLRSSTILFLSNVIVVMSLFGLWISVTQETYWGIYLCILLTAFGFGVIFPTMISYIENDIMKVSGRVTSAIWISNNLQGILFPPLLGYLMQEVSFKWYVYLAIIQGALSFLSFLVLVVVVKVFMTNLDVNQFTLTVNDEVQTAFRMTDKKNVRNGDNLE